jgi:Tol biopolymer transport system component
VWIYELGPGILTRFTRAPAAEFGPLWTADGRRLIYDSERPVFDLYWRVADATQPEQALLASEYDKYPSSISPDGRTLAARLNVPGANEIWLIPLDGAGKPRSFLEAPFNLRHPSFSPNGRWLAYSSNESGQEEVVIVPGSGSCPPAGLDRRGNRADVDQAGPGIGLPEWRHHLRGSGGSCHRGDWAPDGRVCRTV